MLLENLGYTAELEAWRLEQQLGHLGAGRVISEHRERYQVQTPEGIFEGELLGNLRFTAKNREDLPAVGDWVALMKYDELKVLIHAVFPRKSILERPAVGKYGEKQIIATNIDFALIMQAVDRDFNLNRLERYLTLCYNSHVEPLIVLTKTDLADEDELKSLENQVKERVTDAKIFMVNNLTREGYASLEKIFRKGATYCMLGSSGVGKSTLLNNLTGGTRMKTGSISNSTHKGKHVTTQRLLILLENGAILMDNPGMREVGITDSDEGINEVFARIHLLADSCKYNNCTHTTEKGCAVLKALKEGDISEDVYTNYLKIEKEKVHFNQTLAEKRQKDKEFGKMVKDYKRQKKYLSNKHDT